jgi:hypothetical protein
MGDRECGFMGFMGAVSLIVGRKARAKREGASAGGGRFRLKVRSSCPEIQCESVSRFKGAVSRVGRNFGGDECFVNS